MVRQLYCHNQHVYQCACIFQLPIAIVGPGPEPRGRDGITQVESGHDILLPDMI